MPTDAPEIINVINVCNVYKKKLINAFIIFVIAYSFNKRRMKCIKSFVFRETD